MSAPGTASFARVVFVALLLGCQFAATEDFLDPELAFRTEISVFDARTLQLKFEIADGYYLYRKRFRFSIENEGLTSAEPLFPAGKIKQDEFFK